MPIKSSKTAKTGKKPVKRKPTPKQKRFVENYIANGGNGRKAALDAGYAESSASTNTYTNLLENTRIQARIEARRKEASNVTPEEVIGTLTSQMRGDMSEVLTEGGYFDIEHIREQGLGHLIKAITVKREFCHHHRCNHIEVTRFELHSSQSAAGQLCKVLGIEKQPEENPANKRWDMVAIEIEAAREEGEEITREEAERRVKADLQKFIRLARKTGQEVQTIEGVQ